MKEVTIYDIARELNVSAATVSRAINNHKSISSAMKKRVKEAAERMGYRTNTFASSLRSNRTNTIGVIVPRLDSHFMSSVLAGVEKIANQFGYNLIISQSLELEVKEKANAMTMFNNRVDGLIISLASDTTNYEHLVRFQEKGIPVIQFDRVTTEIDCVSIKIDNFESGYAATNHLIQMGCKNLVHITGNLNRNVYNDRLRGFKMALMDHHIEFDEDSVIQSNLSIESGMEIVRQLLQRKKCPDGIFIANDACAAGCIKELKNQKIRIPDEIAVIGFNNDPISLLIEPTLSTINYPGFEMGEIVANAMINYLAGKSELSMTNKIILRSSLIIRESSDRKNKS